MFLTLQLISQHKSLLKINRAFLRVIAIRAFLKKYSAASAAVSASCKMAVVGNIQKVSQVLGLKKTLRCIDLDFKNYARLRKKRSCTYSIYDLCMIKHPSQLLQKEIAVIKSYCADHRFLHWPLISVYHQIKKDGSAYLSSSTFYKYVKLLRLERVKAFSRRKNHQMGIRASKPLEILHADATLLSLKDNTRAFIYLVQDNFSRAILSFRCSLEHRAQFTFENLQYIFEHYLSPSMIEHCNLITDDGTENYGEASKFLAKCQDPEITHFIAQKTIVHSNSMIEAANKQIKYHFLYHKEIPNFEQLENYLLMAVADYNNRPHDAINGLTPIEVLNGKLPSHVSFANQIAKAKSGRITENGARKCCNLSF
jgi:putative transposase